jgi:hypothetical protein
MKQIKDARGYAYDLVDNGFVSEETMLTACLHYMSQDEVLDMLEKNEMILEEDEEDDDPEDCFDYELEAEVFADAMKEAYYNFMRARDGA